MGAAPSFGYCRAIDAVMVKPSTAQLVANLVVPGFVFVLAILFAIIWSTNRFRGLVSCFKFFDVNPQWIHQEDIDMGGSRYIRSKTAAGGIANLTLLICATLIAIYVWRSDLALQSSTAVVQMEPLKTTNPIWFQVRAKIPCGPASYNCSQFNVNHNNTSCYQEDNYCTVYSSVNYNGSASSSNFELTMPMTRNTTQQAFEVQISSQVVASTAGGYLYTREWDPANYPRDFLVFTDSCLSVQNLQLGNDITITTNAAIRRNCQQIAGPRFACGGTVQNNEFKEASIAFDPMATVEQLVTFRSHISVKINLNFNTQAQLSTALSYRSWTSSIIKFLPIVFGIFGFALAIHPIVRNAMSHVVESIELHQRIGTIPTTQAGSAFISVLFTCCSYLVFAVFMFWLNYNTANSSFLLQYSNSNPGSQFDFGDVAVLVSRYLSYILSVIASVIVSSAVFVILKQGKVMNIAQVPFAVHSV